MWPYDHETYMVTKWRLMGGHMAIGVTRPDIKHLISLSFEIIWNKTVKTVKLHKKIHKFI